MLSNVLVAAALLAQSAIVPGVNARPQGECSVSVARSVSSTPETSQYTDLPQTTTASDPQTPTPTSNYSDGSRTATPSSTTGSPGNNSSKTNSARKNMLYFTNWGVYGAQFKPQNLSDAHVSHLIYAFADISPQGEVISSDTYSDLEMHFDGDSWQDQGDNAYGCVKQLYLHKKRNRRLKTLLSIGGWSYSQHGKFRPTRSPDGRRRFADSAVRLLADWGFDGLDIDYEYPQDAQEGKDLVELLRACREALDAYARDRGQTYHYLLTVSASAGPDKYAHQDLRGMDAYVDTWNLMAYDYAGSWDRTAGHQANLFAASDTSPEATKYSTARAVDDYLAAGIAAPKMLLGLPLYGRSFMGTDGLGTPFSGVGQGTVERGVWLYKDLPRPGAEGGVRFDAKAGATYSYDAGTRELVSFDDVRSARAKAQYIRDRGLGGAFYWEAAGDKVGEDSLVGAVAEAMGGGLDESENMLEYPDSRYENIKSGMPDVE